MTTVSVYGWKTGFQKVQFTFLLQRELGYSLREAKARTDAVIGDRSVELQIPGDAELVLESLERLGARFNVLVTEGR